MKVHKVDEETVLLELEPTQYYHLWNLGDLYEHLYKGEKKMTFWVEDFPMDKKDLLELANQLKQK